MGAAAATLLSYFGSAGYLVIISERNIKITYEPVKIMLVLAVIAVFYVVSKLLNVFLADIILFITAFLIVYRLTGFKLKPTGK